MNNEIENVIFHMQCRTVINCLTCRGYRLDGRKDYRYRKVERYRVLSLDDTEDCRVDSLENITIKKMMSSMNLSLQLLQHFHHIERMEWKDVVINILLDKERALLLLTPSFIDYMPTLWIAISSIYMRFSNTNIKKFFLTAEERKYMRSYPDNDFDADEMSYMLEQNMMEECLAEEYTTCL